MPPSAARIPPPGQHARPAPRQVPRGRASAQVRCRESPAPPGQPSAQANRALRGASPGKSIGGEGCAVEWMSSSRSTVSTSGRSSRARRSSTPSASPPNMSGRHTRFMSWPMKKARFGAWGVKRACACQLAKIGVSLPCARSCRTARRFERPGEGNARVAGAPALDRHGCDLDREAVRAGRRGVERAREKGEAGSPTPPGRGGERQGGLASTVLHVITLPNTRVACQGGRNNAHHATGHDATRHVAGADE